VALIALALAFEHIYDWSGVSEETFVAIGSAFFLAGVLFFLERRFLRDVGEVARTAAAQEVAEQTSGLRVGLDQLRARMDDDLRRRDVSHDEAVEAMAVPSYQTVANVLAAANRLGAISHGDVTVQASTDPDELGFTFSWRFDRGDGRHGFEPHRALVLAPRVYADIGSHEPTPYLDTEWHPDETAAEVGTRLIEMLQHRGRWRSAGTLDWAQTLQNLQRALDWAIRSRRRDEGADDLLDGALIELVNDEWAITESGVESPTRRFLLRGDAFPEKRRSSGRIRHQEDEGWQAPACPEGVDAVTWDRVIKRAKRAFPMYRGLATAVPPWSPLMEGPEDEN